MPEKTQVVNVKTGAPYTVYIGRANGRYHLRQSKWHNPFKIGPHGTRDEVLTQYRAYVLGRPELLAQIGELRGQTLGCRARRLLVSRAAPLSRPGPGGARRRPAAGARRGDWLMDSAEAHAQRAFELLGEAEAVIANLLRDPTDQVARVQAELWLQDLETLMRETVT